MFGVGREISSSKDEYILGHISTAEVHIGFREVISMFCVVYPKEPRVMSHIPYDSTKGRNNNKEIIIIRKGIPEEVLSAMQLSVQAVSQHVEGTPFLEPYFYK